MHTDIAYLNQKEQQVIQVFLHNLEKELSDKVVSVFLFGSRARGDAHFDSDVDLVVLVTQDDLITRNQIRDIATEVWLENGLYLSTRVWNQAHWQRIEELQTGLYRNIQRDGIDLLSALAE